MSVVGMGFAARSASTRDRLLEQAAKLIVVGYFFVQADEHFNDLLRHGSPGSKVVVVNPDLVGATREVCRVLGISSDSLVDGTLGGHRTKSSGRLLCISAGASELTQDLLTAMHR